MSVEDDVRQLELRVTALEHALNPSNPSATKPTKAMSIREFINSAKPETQNDRVIIIGYFYEQVLGKGSFTNDDLKSGFIQAKIIGPKNLSDVVAQNARKGLIMEDGSRSGRNKTWVLTNTGEDFVRSMMEKDD